MATAADDGAIGTYRSSPDVNLRLWPRHRYSSSVRRLPALLVTFIGVWSPVDDEKLVNGPVHAEFFPQLTDSRIARALALLDVAAGDLPPAARSGAALTYAAWFFGLYVATQTVEVAYVWSSSRASRRAGA